MYLKAMVMCLLSVVWAVSEAVGAVVGGRVSHEAVLEALVALLVPLEVPDHLLLLAEDFRVALEAVKVIPGGEYIYSTAGRKKSTLKIFKLHLFNGRKKHMHRNFELHLWKWKWSQIKNIYISNGRKEEKYA